MAIQFIGASSGRDSAIIPPHQPGDYIVIFAINFSSSAPFPPEGDNSWFTVGATAQNYISYSCNSKFAASASEVTGIFRNTMAMVVHVYRGVRSIAPYPQGYGFSQTGWGQPSNSLTLPKIANGLRYTNGTSWLVGFGAVNRSISMPSVPSGLTRRESAFFSISGEPWVDDGVTVVSHDTGGGVTETVAYPMSFPGDAARTRRFIFELIAHPSPSATYAVEPSSESAYRGYPVTFTITTTGVADETELFWTLTGDLVSGDTVEGLSGSLEINADAGEVVITLTTQPSVGDEFALEIRTDSISGTVVATSDTVTIVEPTVEISVDAGVVEEGEPINYTIATNLPDGDHVFWWRFGTAGSVPVIVEDPSGPPVVVDSGTATGGGANTLEDTTKSWTVDEHIGSAAEIIGGTGSGQSRTVASNTADTLTVDAAWDTEPDATSIYQIINHRYEASNSANIYDVDEWETSFLGDAPISVVGGEATFTLHTLEDFSTEGNEYVILELYYLPGPTFGPGTVVASSDPTIILDTSNTIGVSFSITPNVTEINEGQSVTFSVTASAMPPLGLLYYDFTGTISSGDINDHGDGEVVMTPDGNGGSTGSFVVTAVADMQIDGGDETFQARLRTGYSGGPIVATSAVITIHDTSWPDPTYNLVAGGTSVNEGSSLSFTLDTTAVAPGTTFFWRLTPGTTTPPEKFTAVSGTFNIGGSAENGSGVFAVSPIADNTTNVRPGIDTGIASSATSNALTDSGKSWGTDEQAGKLLVIISGTGAGQRRLVTTNSADTLIIDVGWTEEPDNTSAYRLVEWFQVEVYRGSSASGENVADSSIIVINDTSVTPPTFSASASRSSVPEGEIVSVSVSSQYQVDDELYYTITGVQAEDFNPPSLSGSFSMNMTTYPARVGGFGLTIAQDLSIEDSESFFVQIRTGSTGGPVVASVGPILIIDESYHVTPSKTIVVEGETVTFDIIAANAVPNQTLYWTIVGSVDGSDFTNPAMSGSVSLVGGQASFSKTVVDDGIPDSGEFFYVLLWRSLSDPTPLTASPAVLVRDAEIDYDEWLNSESSTRIILVEMQHSDGWVYFGNYPYTSHVDDTSPNRPYDDLLSDVIDIETRMDGDLTIGEIAVYHDGMHDDWIGYNWRGYTVRILMGEPHWKLEDFRLIALCTNGGLDAVERGKMRWVIYDAKAELAKPLQTSLLPDGQPVPISLGKPFNVPSVLIDQPNHRYQVNESAIVSVTPRVSGDSVSFSANVGAGTFDLAVAPSGSVAADIVASVTTPATIIGWVADRYGLVVDGDTVAELPSYELGLWYNSQATGGDVLGHVCQSIGGYWVIGLTGQVEVYIFDLPKEVPDFTLNPEDVLLGGLRMIGTDDPVKTLTLNYARNWSPLSMDSISGSVITTQPEFAERLTKQWLQVSEANPTTDFPLAQDLTLDTYLIDPDDAQSEVERIAALRSIRWERWQVDCFVTFAAAQLGSTVEIINPRHGFELGRLGVVVAISRSLTRNRVIFEVMIPVETES